MVNDSDPSSHHLINSIVYVEFLEVICRLTALKYANSELENLDLSQKLNYTLQDFLL